MSADQLTAATARRNYLDPSMDARALNDEQRALLHNASPEIDSIRECLDYLHTHPELAANPMVLLLGELVEKLVASNEAEGEQERLIAGAADQLVRELRNVELNGVRRAITAKSVARAVRSPLAALVDEPGNLDAFSALHAVIRDVPRSQLLSPAVLHEIGPKRFGVLEQLAGAGEGVL